MRATFYPLTALLDLFCAKYVVKTISNKCSPCDGRGRLLENGKSSEEIYRISASSVNSNISDNNVTSA